MGVYSITDSAMSALNIAQAGILTTSQNVAGASVEGFSRRNANATMNALAPNSLMLNGTSFAVEGFTRQYSSLLSSQFLNQQAKSSYSETLVQYTQAIDTLVADQSTGLNTAISNFFNAMGTYAADPTSKPQAAAITASANEVARRIAGMSNLTSQITSDAKKGLVDTALQVNTLLPALAQINQQIIEGRSGGNSYPSADLMDERDRLLSQLQKLVGGQTLINADGTATQLIAGMPLVDRAVANKLVMNGAQDMQTAVYSLKSGANNTTIMSIQHLDGGQAGALFKLVNTFVPKIDQRLDSIALGLVSAANTASRTAQNVGSDYPLAIFGFQVNSDTYPNFYTDDIGNDINNAADVPGQLGEPGISTDANMNKLYDYVANPSNSLTSLGFKAANFISMAPANAVQYFDGNGDSIITSEAANFLQKQSSIFIGSAASLVTDVGVQVATWRSTQKADIAVMRNLKDQKDSLSGVNLDEEAANLLKYQQLYAASTKVLQAGNQMFNTLLSIMN
jgi:flagellar hook-associated protein 1 FlgK